MSGLPMSCICEFHLPSVERSKFSTPHAHANILAQANKHDSSMYNTRMHERFIRPPYAPPDPHRLSQNPPLSSSRPPHPRLRCLDLPHLLWHIV